MDQHLMSALSAVDGTILHLGAGSCRELDFYLRTAAKQIVLVEPDPAIAYSLRLRTEAEPRVKVIEAAVSSQSGTGKLHRYNEPGLATLHPLKKLPSQWPGLSELAQVDVKRLELATLLEQAALAEAKQHWLVIDTPGEEQYVLRALRENHTLPLFAYLSLTIGCLTPNEEQARPLLRQALVESGYRLEDMDTKAGQLVYHAQADMQGQELKASLKGAESTNQRLKNEQQRAEKLQQENRQLKAENEQTQQRQAQLEEELRKAELQVELIKELFLSIEDAEQLETKVKDE